MCDDSSDILMTYNPECLETYSDSSDFDDETLKSGTNHSVLRRKVYRHTAMANYEKEVSSKRYKNKYNTEPRTIHARQCTCKECVEPVEEKQNYLKRKKVKYFNEGDNNINVHNTHSRISLVRSKILPCLSNIFSRSHASNVKDKHVIMNSTKDNCCQVYCVNCNHKRLKRPSKRVHNFAMQSVYSTDNDLDNAPDSGINVDSPNKSATAKDSNLSCSFTSSSISENIQTAKKKFKKMIEREIRKSYLKKLVRQTQEQQLPAKPNYQVFSTPRTSKLSKQDLRDMSSFGCNVMPSNSSVFWEYLVDRINKKYQNNNRSGLLKSCHCTNTQQCPNAMDSLLRDATGPKLDFKSPVSTGDQGTQDVICSCKTSPASGSPNPSQPKMSNTAQKDQTTPIVKIQCKCHTPIPLSPMQKDSPTPQTPLQGQGSDDMNRPCQEPHDQIKASLEKKYNGEILCIHNPPCILINGCLNLPPVKGQFSPSAWPVTQRSSFHCGFHKEEINKQHQEQACQYQHPDFTLQQRLEAEYKTEKMTQSICNHDPPCEVVRCCYKPEFDPKLENSCVHVPMCQRLPECVINESVNLMKCDHQPQCTELPVCKRKPKKYIVLAARDTIGTQVKPNVKMECKHDPPCIFIPKCLGKLMCEGYVPCEAIPDCIHQPTCESIPACCRKSAKMNSFFKRGYLKRRQKSFE
ncbi:uncharacterized protein LOC135077208 [Ostrinia nubilalis]|uniref:uncharacterized protein LOC135077208 n=1 Tax=Ostrinia nubilalis TaxID=29057 RepID=UPI00308252F9